MAQTTPLMLRSALPDTVRAPTASSYGHKAHNNIWGQNRRVVYLRHSRWRSGGRSTIRQSPRSSKPTFRVNRSLPRALPLTGCFRLPGLIPALVVTSSLERYSPPSLCHPQPVSKSGPPDRRLKIRIRLSALLPYGAAPCSPPWALFPWRHHNGGSGWLKRGQPKGRGKRSRHGHLP